MKRIICILAAALALSPVFLNAQDGKYANRAAMIAAQIHDPSSKYVVVVCHRGDWRNFPENSIPAIESIIRMGADMMELDLKMTKDSVLVLSHDSTLDRCTNGKGKIKDYTYQELLQFGLKKGHGVVVDTLKIPTLRQALEVCKDRICVNVDQGYSYYDQVLAIAEELGVVDQILIKSGSTIDKVAVKEAKHAHNAMYMPVVSLGNEEGRGLFESYIARNVVPLAYELCFSGKDREIFDDACRRAVAQGSKVWVNTIWPSLCGGYGHDDDAAYVTGDCDAVYGPLLDKGVSIIQTDRPEMLVNYLRSIGRHDE